jgi:hypothetical protein
MRRVTVLIALLTVGCGTKLVDPCAGATSSCLALHIDASPSVRRISNAQIHVSGGGIDQTQTVGLKSAATSADLPVAVAIVFPNLADATTIAVHVVGILESAPVGQGDLEVSMTPGAHMTAHVQLTSGSSGNGVDMAVPLDGSSDGPLPNVVSFYPSSISFGTIDRGSRSIVRMVTLSNDTPNTVSTTMAFQPTGDVAQWQFDSSQTTCFATDGGTNPTITVAAHSSCSIGYIFAPATSGTFVIAEQANFDDGESASFTVSGVARRTWSLEVIPNTTGLNSVWGSGPNDLFVGGPTVVQHSVGDGQWLGIGGDLGASVLSIFGADASNVWAIPIGGKVFKLSNTLKWVEQTTPTGNGPRAGWAANATTAFAVTDIPNPQILALSGSTWSPVLPANAPNAFFGLCGFGVTGFAVGGQAMIYATDASHTFQNLGSVLGTDNATLRACWMSDANTAWVVGDSALGIITIFKCVASGSTWTCTHETAGTNIWDLAAVAGRIDTTSGKLDVYVVGAQGMLHSDGSGQWTIVQTPTMQGLQSVWVAQNGDVLAVGGNGEMVHYR